MANPQKAISEQEWREVEELQLSTASNKLRRVMENYPYVAHLVGGAITTAGIQYTTYVVQTTGITSKSSALKTAISSTISWPGLEGKNIDEAEFGLTIEQLSTGTASTAVAATTFGYFVQMKNSTGSTWQNISAVETTKGSTSATPRSRTLSGYRLYRDGSLATGYNKLPINIRIRFFGKSQVNTKLRVKSSSYVAIKPR